MLSLDVNHCFLLEHSLKMLVTASGLLLLHHKLLHLRKIPVNPLGMELPVVILGKIRLFFGHV